MRFISPIGALRIIAIHDTTQPDPDGFTRTVKPGYTVEFKQGLLTPFERQLARERLHFPGGITDRRNVDGTPYDYIPLAGVFDTEWIDDPGLRASIEKFLQNPKNGCGYPDNYILVEQPRQPRPWESYDRLTIQGRRTPEMVAEKNLEIASETGTPVEHLIAYERENRNDERLIALYNAALADEPSPELVQA